MTANNKTFFLPTTKEEMKQLGWNELDILLISGDAYIDHPSFGPAIIGKYLLKYGYKVGIIAQPSWHSTTDIAKMGKPRLFIGISGGSLDSMLAHYTAFRKKRNTDTYTPGGETGKRPNRAVIVYANIARQAFPETPIIIGGIEASLRRFAHYDFWENKIRNSILLDSKADLLVYGMAEKAVLDIARRIDEFRKLHDTNKKLPSNLLHGIKGTVFAINKSDFSFSDENCIFLPSCEEIITNPDLLLKATTMAEQQVHEAKKRLIQKHADRIIIAEPPQSPLLTQEIDEIYALPFTREQHPSYKNEIPALRTVQFTITTHRGCAGGCSFCALALHQGRKIQSRSFASIIKEATVLAQHPKWRGTIENVGAATANMWSAKCRINYSCNKGSCLWPQICPNFICDQKKLAELLEAIRALPNVSNVRSASGIRHDLAERNQYYLEKLISNFTGGHLTVAPEHCCDNVLYLMRKPPFLFFERF